MNKNLKKQPTSRRQLLKKLSYSPPLLLCLGTLTRPNIAGGSHGLSSTDWLQTGEGMAAATLADQVATATVAQDIAFGGTEQPGRREEIRSQSFEQSYQQYLDGLDAEH